MKRSLTVPRRHNQPSMAPLNSPSADRVQHVHDLPHRRPNLCIHSGASLNNLLHLYRAPAHKTPRAFRRRSHVFFDACQSLLGPINHYPQYFRGNFFITAALSSGGLCMYSSLCPRGVSRELGWRYLRFSSFVWMLETWVSTSV